MMDEQIVEPSYGWKQERNKIIRLLSSSAYYLVLHSGCALLSLAAYHPFTTAGHAECAHLQIMSNLIKTHTHTHTADGGVEYDEHGHPIEHHAI
jgi:hypothetical protein